PGERIQFRKVWHRFTALIDLLLLRNPAMKLLSNRYGKARVRVLKILREGATHTIKEVDVTVLLKGDFDGSYIAADNSKVVPTDTIKNTVNVLSKEHLGREIQRFGLSLGQHFLKRYEQVASASIEISAKNWTRMQIDGQPHPHAFLAGSDAKNWTRIVCTRDSETIESGVRDLLILKSTGSGWAGYPKCENTTLPETNDRILATSFDATWTWSSAPKDYDSADDSILAAMLKAFANNFSPSAQASVFQMAEAALQACPEISRVEAKMPNKHYILINTKPFGLENQNEIFVPTDDPFGVIEGTVVRE
ncbi:MAG: factor-independent urate hydroxylase, partial [Chthoniobacterales bacterium]